MAIFEISGQPTLTQWDVGRKLIITEKCSSVHFANSAMTEAMVSVVTENDGAWMADIPDEVLQVSGPLRVYAFVDGEEGYTREMQKFQIKPRPKPGDYVYVPTQVKTWEELEERIGELEVREETDPTVPDWAKQAKKPAYTATEVGARESTWLPTLAEIGAAPAGYGLGGGSAGFDIATIDNKKESGWFNASSPYGYYIGTVPLYYIVFRVDSWKDRAGYPVVSQTIYYNQSKIRRTCYANGTWGEWEWENPPMVIGTEYRTVERYNGKAVYCKLVNCGSLVANTATAIKYSDDTICRAISVGDGISNGMAVQTGLLSPVASDAVSNPNWKINFGSYCNFITVEATNSCSDVSVIVRYYKNTD